MFQCFMISNIVYRAKLGVMAQTDPWTPPSEEDGEGLQIPGLSLQDRKYQASTGLPDQTYSGIFHIYCNSCKIPNDPG